MLSSLSDHRLFPWPPTLVLSMLSFVGCATQHGTVHEAETVVPPSTSAQVSPLDESYVSVASAEEPAGIVPLVDTEDDDQPSAREAAEDANDSSDAGRDDEDGQVPSAANQQAQDKAPAAENLPPPQPQCSSDGQLTLDQVLAAVAHSYPLLEVALGELSTAEGKALAAWGSFDTVVSGYSASKPVGFYENYQHGAKVSRPLWQGGEVYGAYRIGRGEFEPWYQERATNDGGEFKSGVKLPFLKGYVTDGRRTAVQVANLERARLEPDIQARVLGMQRAASQVYWKWVAAGQVVRTQEQLLELARARNENLIKQVEAGDLPKITEIDNGRFIAKRQAKLIESRRKVQEAAIKLSLFLRNEVGQPIVATPELLPCEFPPATSTDPSVVESDIARAISQRPELLELDFQRQQVEAELCYAQNQTLPKLDAYAEAGQDMGAPTSSSRDKSPLEVEMGLLAEVPLQRRLACGKIRAAEGKLVQIAAKRRFTEDKIRSQVLDAVSALDNAFSRIEQARENLRLTEQSLRLGRLRFEEGDIDIIQLNIYETSLAEAKLLLIDAEFAFFIALADYRAALGIEC